MDTSALPDRTVIVDCDVLQADGGTRTASITGAYVALMLALSGCDWEPRRVDYFDGETRGEAYRGTVNEMGEAPVLEHAGKRLTQSGVILTYLAERTGRLRAGACCSARSIIARSID